MLESKVSNMIAQSQQKVVVPIVPSPEENTRLSHDVGEPFLNGGCNSQRGFAVGDEVEFVVDGLARGREVDNAVVLAFDDGRVNQQIKGDRLESNAIAGHSIDGERGAVLPAVGENQRRVVGELRRGRAGGIEGDFVPLEDEELVGGGAGALM